MKSPVLIALVGALALAPAALAQAPASAPAPSETMRTLDPENVLLIETGKGRILVELEPRVAPNHVTRIKELARERFYDGLLFHRVIGDFMAQTGDPTATGTGQSSKPDLTREFEFRRGADVPFTPVQSASGVVSGFVGSMPVVTQPDDLMVMTQDGRVRAYGVFCPSVAGMARGGSPDSANSQFFLMRGREDQLDGQYTPWGRVVSGMDVVRALNAGEPPPQMDAMTRVRVLADVPAAERPTVRVPDTTSAAFRQRVDALRAQRGAGFSICDVEISAEVG